MGPGLWIKPVCTLGDWGGGVTELSPYAKEPPNRGIMKQTWPSQQGVWDDTD